MAQLIISSTTHSGTTAIDWLVNRLLARCVRMTVFLPLLHSRPFSYTRQPVFLKLSPTARLQDIYSTIQHLLNKSITPSQIHRVTVNTAVNGSEGGLQRNGSAELALLLLPSPRLRDLLTLALVFVRGLSCAGRIRLASRDAATDEFAVVVAVPVPVVAAAVVAVVVEP